MDKTTYTSKVIVLGNSNVGKTCIINRLINHSFIPREKSTLNLELESKTYHFPNGSIRLNIWDTVGQERYHSLAQFYLREASLAVIVFDVGQRDSFNDVARWVEMIGNDVSHEVLIFVAGNKIDNVEEFFTLEGKK